MCEPGRYTVYKEEMAAWLSTEKEIGNVDGVETTTKLNTQKPPSLLEEYMAIIVWVVSFIYLMPCDFKLLFKLTHVVKI